MNILAWIIVGLIGGAIAKLIMPGDDPGGSGIVGIIITILLGIAGAIVGGIISVAVGIGDGVDDFDAGTLILSIIGSILLLIVYRVIVGARARPRP